MWSGLAIQHSRRVARIWFIWFLRSVSCVWFDEREGQDRPAHQIDCLRIALAFHNAPTIQRLLSMHDGTRKRCQEPFAGAGRADAFPTLPSSKPQGTLTSFPK